MGDDIVLLIDADRTLLLIDGDLNGVCCTALIRNLIALLVIVSVFMLIYIKYGLSKTFNT
ncbi:hypothetical protein [Paenibacillus sp. Z3-2]